MTTRWDWERAGSLGPPELAPQPGKGLKVTIEGRPVSWNHGYIRTRAGRVVLTQEARAWKDQVFYVTLDTLNRSSWRPRGPRIAVHYWLTLGTPMDSDNVSKLLCDAIAKALKVNDRIFLPRAMGIKTGQPDERVVVYLTNEAED